VCASWLASPFVPMIVATRLLPSPTQQPAYNTLTTKTSLRFLYTPRYPSRLLSTQTYPAHLLCRAPPPKPSEKSPPPRQSKPVPAARPLPGGLPPRAAKRPPRLNGPLHPNESLRPSEPPPSAARPLRGKGTGQWLWGGQINWWGGRYYIGPACLHGKRWLACLVSCPAKIRRAWNMSIDSYFLSPP